MLRAIVATPAPSGEMRLTVLREGNELFTVTASKAQQMSRDLTVDENVRRLLRDMTT